MCADWAVSIRRACGALRFDRSSYHYQSRRTDPAELKRRIREICETRVRYGYRRVHVILRREGWDVSIKKVYSVYRGLGMQLTAGDTVELQGYFRVADGYFAADHTSFWGCKIG